MSVKVKAAEMTDVDAVAFEEATFLATHPDRALFPETGVKVTVPLMRDKGTGFEVLKGESVAYHVLELLDV